LEVMQYTRSSVSLRAYGQQDPLTEYKKEGTRLFKEMQEAALHRIAAILPTVEKRVVDKEEEELRKAQAAAKLAGGAEDTSATGNQKGVQAIKRNEPGRNEIVKVTNGTEIKEMKYKKAEPLLASGEWQRVD